MLDLKQRFEELGHDGPDHRPVRDRLDAGHRALRRRRSATGAATLAVMVVVGTGAWALGGGENRAEPGPQYASEPTTSAAAADAPVPIGPHEQLAEHSGEGVFYDEQTGELQRAVGAEVTRLVTDPIPTDAKKSVALEVDYRGETRWMYLYWSPDSGGAGSDPAQGGETFDDWVADLDPDLLQQNFGYGAAHATAVKADPDTGKRR